MQDLPSIKKALHQRCLTLAEDRIVSLQHILKEAQQAANNETKSSAGDKHETGKAMDKSELTRLERKALRVEVREIKSAVRASGNGIYISSGAIIIILLLIIIL